MIVSVSTTNKEFNWSGIYKNICETTIKLDNMTDICRLCLSVCPDLIHNLSENSEIMTKIATCLQLRIPNVDSLPNRICNSCKERIDQIHSFLKSVIENQNILHGHLISGKDCLETFYLSLKNVTEENKDNVLKLKEEDTVENIKIPNDIEIKHENNEYNFEESVEYSSDDEIALISLKEMKEKNEVTFKGEQNKNKEKTIKEMHLKENSDSTETKENILIHSTSNSTKISEYKCLTCFAIFGTRFNLTKHYKNAHQPADPPTYDIKNYSTVEEGGETKFKCGICEKIYRVKKHVHSHIQYKHQKSRPYICNLCGRTFKVISEIIQHLRAHNGVKLFCSYNCGYSSVYIAALRAHEKRHRNEYKYKCDKCGKGFDVRTWYEEHQNIHTGAKPFVCDTCGLAYPFKRYLVKHQTDTHPIATPPSDRTKFLCVHCSLPCDTKIALKTHLSMEHGIKQCFLCDICGKSFKRSCHLISHKKYHIGIKNHACSTCDKSFITRSALKRHEQTHTGYQKKHACGKCGKRYTQRDALHKHQLRYHSLPTPKCPEIMSNEKRDINIIH